MVRTITLELPYIASLYGDKSLSLTLDVFLLLTSRATPFPGGESSASVYDRTIRFFKRHSKCLWAYMRDMCEFIRTNFNVSFALRS